MSGLIRTRQILKEARDIWSENPLRDGHIAVDVHGDGVEYDDPSAWSWCAIGAICKAGACGSDIAATSVASRVLLDVLWRETGRHYELSTFNDSGTLTVAHWNKAIESLGGEP